MAERFDGVKFPLPHNPMKFCKFLFEERYNKSEPNIQQFHISRAFNFEDQICPILPVSGKSNLIILIDKNFPVKSLTRETFSFSGQKEAVTVYVPKKYNTFARHRLRKFYLQCRFIN